MPLTQVLSLPPERRAIAIQVVRYAIAGLLITVAMSAFYWALTYFAHLDANLALAVSFLLFTAISYVTHGAFSFRGHGERDRVHVRATRFLLVNLIGFALNQAFVWLLVKQLGGPSWWPIAPFVLVTPWVTFALHRRWVYS